MKNILLGLLVVILLVVVGLVAFRDSLRSLLPERFADTFQNQQPIAAPTPIAPILGSDRDEHGCILSAGYSWCAAKSKCYRPFEESCNQSDDNEQIRQALFTKNNWKDSDGISLTVSTNDGTYASGTVASQGGGGYFYAIKTSSGWEIVADGNGIIPCSALTNYPDYPKTLISTCFDQSADKLIKR